MIKKQFTLEFNKESMHNSILLTKKVSSSIVVNSIYILDRDGSRIELIDKPIHPNNNTSIQYKSISSNYIIIEVEHPLGDSLDLNDLLHLNVRQSQYGSHGIFRSKDHKINFGKFINIVSDIENFHDSYINMTLNLRVYNRFDDLIENGQVLIGLGEDGDIAKIIKTDDDLYLDAIEDSIKVYVNGNSTAEFSYKNGKLLFSIPNGAEVLVIYRPEYMNSIGYTKLHNNISANYNREILIENEAGSYILYNVELEIVNPSISSYNSTPIIKNISVISSNDQE